MKALPRPDHQPDSRYAMLRLGVTLLVFIVTRLTPGDPARVLRGPSSTRATEEQIETLRAAYGLNQPIYLQYVTWLGHVVRGDFGESVQLHRPVLGEVVERFRGTLVLAMAAMFAREPREFRG